MERTQFLGYVDGDVDGLRHKYAQAREAGYKTLADEYIDVTREARIGQKRRRKYEAVRDVNGNVVVDDNGQPVMKQTEDSIEEYDAVDRARLHSDGLRWMLSKALPKIYGDKIQVEPPTEAGGTFTVTFK